MNPIPGELYLVDLGMTGKVRPAVIVSRDDPDSPRALALCAPLTLGQLNFLDKESWINVQGLMSVGHEKLTRKLGRIPARQLDLVKDALRFALDL